MPGMKDLISDSIVAVREIEEQKRERMGVDGIADNSI
jgi:hypothetical protein